MNPRTASCAAIVLVAVVGCLLAPARARAQTDAEKKAQAKELYERATRLYDVGKYGEAIEAYEQAYLLMEDPALLYNIGQAYRLWDRPEEAIRSYKNYLRKRPQASNRAEVERKIADLERTVDERHRAQAGPVTPEPTSAANPAPVEATPAQPAAEAPYAPQATTPAAVAPLTAAQPAAGQDKGGGKHNWLGYGLVAGGGVLIVVAALSAAAGRQESNKLRDASQNGQPFDPTVEKNGKAANAVAYISLAAGLVAGGVGGYLLWRGRSTNDKAVALVPALAPGYAGGAAVVTF